MALGRRPLLLVWSVASHELLFGPREVGDGGL